MESNRNVVRYKVPKDKTPYEVLGWATTLATEHDDIDLIVEMVCIATQFEGVASLNQKGQVGVFCGADDGSDDCLLSPEEFNSQYIIKRVFTEEG